MHLYKIVNMDKKSHWESVYASKQSHEVSWYEPDPYMSLELIRSVAPLPVRVVDIGAGQSHLVDRLMEEGHTVAVLDISSAAIHETKNRMGSEAARVQWIEGDITTLADIGSFDVWHDRAVFHFLTTPQDREKYVALLKKTVPVKGFAIMGTFGKGGPEKCSGLDICQYDAASLRSAMGPSFCLIRETEYTHTTPWGKPQKFFFAILQRIE